MKQSQLFGKTLREAPKNEVSVNAKLLEKGGFIYKNSAGVYSYLPLGWRVLSKIESIIREEINAIGGQEIFMPALVEKKYLDATGRWDVEISFEALGKKEKNASFVLGWTHEEVLTAIASKYINSYKDLPLAAYQIQTKFRNEPRAKSGLLRGREFIMKDLYSFHALESDFKKYYEIVKKTYLKIFKRCGLKTVYTLAAGGDYTAENTHEFHVLCPVGEDVIFVCLKCGYAENKEISKLSDGGRCFKCAGKIKKENAIEVGNIFSLGTKYSDALNLKFLNSKGKKESVIMGSYGIGLGRTMGAIVETCYDNNGIIWPKSVAPFQFHLIELNSSDLAVKKEAKNMYKTLLDKGAEVLYDDRGDKSAGEKFADSDLIGIPKRIIISEKTLDKKSIEIKDRKTGKINLIKISNFKNAQQII